MEITFEKATTTRMVRRSAGGKGSRAGGDAAKVALELTSLGQVSELLEWAHSAGGQRLEFAVHSPNLSDAFIALTGHALRDATG